MDWPMASPGWDVQEAWVENMNMFGWGLLIWAAVAATLAVLLLPIVNQAVRRRRFWCVQAEGEVEVEFEERGIIGFRRAVAVRSCSVFDPPTQVHCRRSCLDGDVRVRLPMTLPRPWRFP
jgi:heme exporter protein D